MIRIGIIGSGGTVSVAERHLEAIRRDGRASVTAVLNSRKETAEAWIRTHHLSAQAFQKVESFMEKVDAVVICTPNCHHTLYVKEAMAHHRHCLVEKPLGMDAAECRELLSLAPSGLVQMVGYTNRFASIVSKAREVIRTRMGKVYTITAFYGGKRLANPQVGMEWRMTRALSGSGALGDFGSHLIDLVYYLTGIRFSAVSCMMDTMVKERSGRHVENDDAASFLCRGDGALASFSVSRVGQDDLHLFLSGEGGMMELCMRGEGALNYWEKDKSGGYTGRMTPLQFSSEEPVQGAFDEEMRVFLDAVEGKRMDYPGLAEGLYAAEVIDAAEKAAREKREIRIGGDDMID